MRKIILMCTLISFLLCGCNNSDIFGAGESSFDLSQPYSNEADYLLVNYDIKPVGQVHNTIIGEYDFSGPMNALLNPGEINSTNTTIITQPTAVTSESVNANLPVNTTTGLCAPLDPGSNGRLTSSFGYRRRPTAGASSYHKGIDVAAPAGTEIYAVDAGTVTKVATHSAMGKYVIITHTNSNSGITSATYEHMSSQLVSEGDTIQKGQLIGKVGSTGVSTGNHLHIGLKDSSNEWTNPLDYLPTGWYH